MSLVVTEHTSSAYRAAREALDRGMLDVGTSQRQLAGLVECSKSKVAQWVAGSSHAPLYLLAHPGVPEALRARLRSLVPSLAPVSVPCETTSALLVGDVGATLHSLGAALADGVVTADERRVLAPLVRQLRARCDQWLRRHGGEL